MKLPCAGFCLPLPTRDDQCYCFPLLQCCSIPGSIPGSTTVVYVLTYVYGNCVMFEWPPPWPDPPWPNPPWPNPPWPWPDPPGPAPCLQSFNSTGMFTDRDKLLPSIYSQPFCAHRVYV